MEAMPKLHHAVSAENAQIFIQVARLGSFSKAASVLLLDSSAVSRKMKSLEDDFHTTFFNRTSKGITLTPNGEAFFVFANQLLEQLSVLTDHFLTLEFKVGTYDSLSATLFSDFFSSHFSNAHLISNDTNALVDAFRSSALNLVIMDQEFASALRTLTPSFKELNEKDISEHFLFDEPYYLVTNHPVSADKEITDFTLLLQPETCPIHQKIRQIIPKIDPKKIISIEFSASAISLLTKTRATILPECVIHSLSNPALHFTRLPQKFDRHLTVFAKNQMLLNAFLLQIQK